MYKAQRNYNSLLCLPGSTVLPRVTLSSLHGKKIQKSEVKRTQQGTRHIQGYTDMFKTNSFQRKYSPYIHANAQIRHALSYRKPFQTREELRSKQLEQFMILAEKEAKVRRPWKYRRIKKRLLLFFVRI